MSRFKHVKSKRFAQPQPPQNKEQPVNDEQSRLTQIKGLLDKKRNELTSTYNQIDGLMNEINIPNSFEDFKKLPIQNQNEIKQKLLKLEESILNMQSALSNPVSIEDIKPAS
jgi:hypothetical protein